MKDWAAEITAKIDRQLTETKEKDLRFFRIEEFKRNIRRTEEFAPKCPVCHANKVPISDITLKLAEAVESPGKTRKEYDRLISRLSKHMQKAHNFYPPYLFTYLYSFIGICAGVVTGTVISFFIPEYRFELITVFFSLGLIPGYLTGNAKDSKIRRNKHLM